MSIMGKEKPDFDQIKYQNEYNKQKYDRVTIMVPKGLKEEIKAFAKYKGMSMNEFLVGLVEQAMEKG